MSKFFHYLIRRVISLFPESRFFKLKALMWQKIYKGVSRKSRIYSSVKIFGPIDVSIGDDTFIGTQTLISGGDSLVTIGKNCDVSSRVKIITGSHKFDPEGDRMAGEGIAKDIVIGDGVWVGTGATILGGVSIGNMAMIGAESLVIDNVEPYTVVAGNPAKAIKKWDTMSKKWLKIN